MMVRKSEREELIWNAKSNKARQGFFAQMLGAIVYAIFSETVWLLAGAVGGFAGIFVGSRANPRARERLSRAPLHTVPGGALASGGAAALLLASGISGPARFLAMLAVNGGIFGALFLWSLKQ